MINDVLSHFGELDELIQVVYQGFDRFVVLSTVSDAIWTVYVGLKGPEGRWWRGSWSEQDVVQFIGSRSNAHVLESFAHNLAATFVSGQLSIDGWAASDTGPGARINLTFGPTSKKPVHIPLVELSTKEAASHATTVFSAIAIEAQSRKSRLNPPSFWGQTAGQGRTRTESVGHAHSPKKTHVPGSAASPVQAQVEDKAEAAAQRKIKTLEAELAQVKAAKKVKSQSPSSESEPKTSAAVRRPKGASLANPHKKARRYQEVEFGSDDD